jgi:hypothetical protein
MGKSPKKAASAEAGSSFSVSRFNRNEHAHKLIGQACPSLCPTTCKHLAAVRGSHTLSEAMFFFAVQLLRLKSSEHKNPPFG